MRYPTNIQSRIGKAALLCLAAVTSLGTACAEEAVELKNSDVVTAAGLIIGYDAGLYRPFAYCAQAYMGEGARAITQKLSAVHAANDAIVAMARLKVLALLDQQGQPELRDATQQAYDVRIPAMAAEQFRKLTSTREARENLCAGLLQVEPTKFYLARKYPFEVARIIEFRTGYSWSTPICDFKVKFLASPTVMQLSSNGVPIEKAVVSVGGGLPTLSANCLSRPPVADLLALKAASQAQLDAAGVRDVAWIDRDPASSATLQAIGRLERAGYTATYSVSWWVGRNSILEASVVEPPDQFPSPISDEFIASVVPKDGAKQ